jgi:hypothetical protein
MTNDIRVVSSPDGGWMVALDEQSLAGFYGPDARMLAESHRDVLVEILSAGAAADVLGMATDTPDETWVH